MSNRIDDMRAAQARAQFRAAGGTVTKCEPGAARGSEAPGITARGRTKAGKTDGARSPRRRADRDHHKTDPSTGEGATSSRSIWPKL